MKKNKQASRRLVRSLLTICNIGISLHPWALCRQCVSKTKLRFAGYSAAYAKFERH